MSLLIGWACLFSVGAYGMGLLVVLAVLRASEERISGGFEPAIAGSAAALAVLAEE